MGSRIEVLLPGALAADAGGARRVEVEVAEPARLADVLDALDGRYPLLARRIRDETGALRRHVNVYLGGDDVRGLLGTDAPVSAGDSVLVLPNVAGG